MPTQIYSYPNATDGNGLLNLFVYVNNTSDGIFMPLVLLAIFIIMFVIALSNSRASNAFLVSCFITAILGIPLTIMNMLAPSYMYLLGFGVAVGVFWSSLDT